MCKRSTPYVVIIIFLFWGMIYLSACQVEQPTPQTQESIPTQMISANPPLTDTAEPTATEIPIPTETSLPTETPIPIPAVIDGPTLPDLFLIPSGYAQSDEWQGIPIVNEVIHAQEAYDGYYYSADVHVRIIKEFYQDRLDQAGWQLTGEGKSERGDIRLVFIRDNQQLEISLYDFYTSDSGGQSPIELPQSIVLIVFK